VFAAHEKLLNKIALKQNCSNQSAKIRIVEFDILTDSRLAFRQKVFACAKASPNAALHAECKHIIPATQLL
jgi:hypothetical protein